MALVRRYWLALLFALLGIIAIFAAVGSATIWRPPSTQSATLSGSVDSHLVTTRPGVLRLYDSDVTVSATGKGEVFLAIGRSTDVAAWSEGLAQAQIDGINKRGRLQAQNLAGRAGAKLTSPAASDMWIEPKTSHGEQVSLSWDQRPGQWSVIAYSSEGTPRLTLQWRAPVRTPWLVPLLITGVVLLVLAAVVAALVGLRQRKKAPAGPLGEEAAQPAAALPEDYDNRAEGDYDPQATATYAAVGEPLPDAADTAESDSFQRQGWDSAVAQGQAEIDSETDLVSRMERSLPPRPQTSSPRPHGGLPSRRQMREARKRGQATIEVDGISYPTGLIPVVRASRDTHQQPEPLPEDRDYEAPQPSDYDAAPSTSRPGYEYEEDNYYPSSSSYRERDYGLYQEERSTPEMSYDYDHATYSQAEGYPRGEAAQLEESPCVEADYAQQGYRSAGYPPAGYEQTEHGEARYSYPDSASELDQDEYGLRLDPEDEDDSWLPQGEADAWGQEPAAQQPDPWDEPGADYDASTPQQTDDSRPRQ